MAGTQDDETGSPKPKASTPGEVRLARQAEALRANLRRRKVQSRDRAGKRPDGPTTAD